MFTPVAENTGPTAVLNLVGGFNMFQHVSASSYVNYVHPKENLQQLAIPKAD
jgi:hypothetical protein